MESTLQQTKTHQQLVSEFDRLGAKIEQARELISQLRADRDKYRDECENLRSERAIVLETAGVADMDALLSSYEGLTQIKNENSGLMSEREEIARRLESLIEKVDLLDQDS
jgi:uncharacterized coiled-coil DUF342 family protein